jgi:hypothetical protein
MCVTPLRAVLCAAVAVGSWLERSAKNLWLYSMSAEREHKCVAGLSHAR